MENTTLDYIRQEMQAMGYQPEDYSFEVITHELSLSGSYKAIIPTEGYIYFPYIGGRMFQIFAKDVETIEFISETGYISFEIYEQSSISGTNGQTFYPAEIGELAHIGNIKVNLVLLPTSLVTAVTVRLPFIRVTTHPCKPC